MWDTLLELAEGCATHYCQAGRELVFGRNRHGKAERWAWAAAPGVRVQLSRYDITFGFGARLSFEGTLDTAVDNSIVTGHSGGQGECESTGKGCEACEQPRPRELRRSWSKWDLAGPDTAMRRR
jgi:hypothetical protein